MPTPQHPRQRPVFVYGTLLPDHHNHARLLAGNTVGELPAHVDRHRLYVKGVPYAVPVDDPADEAPRPLVGVLITVTPDRYDQVIARLDSLEGYRPNDPDRSHYRRVLVGVTVGSPLGGESLHTHHRAWIYIAGPRFDPTGATLIHSGDYERADQKVGPR